MRLVSIASGSSGNCIYVGSDHSHILVDAGISNKRIEQGLNEIGLKGSELDGVVITHEHSDHIKGLGVLARKHHVPIYGTKETLEEVAANTKLGEYPKELLHPVLPDARIFRSGILPWNRFPSIMMRPIRWLTGSAMRIKAWRWQRIWVILTSTSLTISRIWTRFF